MEICRHEKVPIEISVQLDRDFYVETEDVTERKSSVNVMRYRFHIIRDLCEMFSESITERGHPDMMSASEGEGVMEKRI